MRTRTALMRALLAATVVAGLAGATAATAGDTDRDDDRRWQKKRADYQAGVNVPVVSTPNIDLVTTFPETQAISGTFATSAPYFYVSSLDSISVFDVSDPLQPKLTGTLPNLVFENEAMNYGEQTVDGTTHRFVLVGNDLYQSAPTDDPTHVNAGGGEMMVVDVTDPTSPHIRSRIKVPTSTHTVACIQETSCEYAYTAGNKGRFSIIDLRDLDTPKLLHETLESSPESPAAAPNAAFSGGAGHKWNFDTAGYGLHTGSGGTAIFDVRDPADPRLVTTTDFGDSPAEWNDFIHHNSARPNAGKFSPGAPPSVANGNVLLVTEEDYENTDCATAGSFQTWYVEKLDGSPARITKLDKINPVDVGEGVALPHMAFCSAHWFDFHQSGIVAQGYYEGGLRLMDVRDPRNITEYGYFASGLSEVWDAYWVPVRNRKGSVTGAKTNIVYTADLVRGLDVFTVDLPGGDTSPAAPAAVDVAAPLSTDRPTVPPANLLVVALALLPLFGLGAASRRRVLRH
ncbi:MAG: LVIVD repeat-containing protein [Micromonosporaceae bacterium]